MVSASYLEAHPVGMLTCPIWDPAGLRESKLHAGSPITDSREAFEPTDYLQLDVYKSFELSAYGVHSYSRNASCKPAGLCCAVKHSTSSPKLTDMVSLL